MEEALKAKIKKKIRAWVLGLLAGISPWLILVLMAATGVLGIMSLDDGIDDRIEKNIINTNYDNVTIDDMIRICSHDESFEHYFENCALTQRQMLRMLQRIKKLNARNLTGSGTSRKRTIRVQALHEYEEYILVEEDAVIGTEIIDGEEVEIKEDIYEWQEKSDYDTWYTYSYDTSDIEKLCQIDWQIIYTLLTLQAASGDRNWNYESSMDWDSEYVKAFCGYCGKALDGREKCPVCDYQQEIENDDRVLNEYGYCTQCGEAYDSTHICKVCTEKVPSEAGKITNVDIDALLEFFVVDYEYSYDVASMLKDSYYYEQSQSIPFKYHSEEETIPEDDAGKKRNGKYTWFEPATLVMNTCNGFLYAWYDVEKDMNGNPVVTPQNLYNGREGSLEAYRVGYMHTTLDLNTLYSGLSECFDNPEKFDYDWIMEMVRQLPGGEIVAAKYEGYETSAMADGRILSATEHGAEIFVPGLDFFNKVQSQLEAADNADIDIGGMEYDETTGGMIARYAMSKVGCSYVWGTSGPNTFDCSGLVNWCAKMCGLTVPWAKVPGVSATNTRRSAANAQGYINAGKAIPESEMKQGDIIFFASEGTPNTVKNITHVGIYVGNGKFVDARNKKKGVLLSEYSAYWKKRATVIARPY